MGTISISFEEELTEAEQTFAAGVLTGLVDRLIAARKLAPHVVSHNPVTIPGENGKRDAIFDCPDCTRGLTGGAYKGIPVRFCIRLNRPPYPEGLNPTPNDIIACGGGR